MQKEPSHEKFMNELGFVGLQLPYLTHISTSVCARSTCSEQKQQTKIDEQRIPLNEIHRQTVWIAILGR
jgi:hypothetical protein